MQIHTTCRHCRDTQLMSTAQPELRISYMPDEHAYLTWQCEGCGEWQAKLLDARNTVRLIGVGIPVDDLSLVDPTVEAASMPFDQNAEFRLEACANTPTLLALAIDDVIHRSRPRRVRPPQREVGE